MPTLTIDMTAHLFPRYLYCFHFQRSVLKPKSPSSRPLPTLPSIGSTPIIGHGGVRLNKFVRRLHDMLIAEKESGIVEWRRGLLVLHSTDAFAKTILPKYFNTRNFKTFRRQVSNNLLFVGIHE